MQVQTKGTVDFMWQGKDGRYFARVAYWVGTGFQRVEREVTQGTYEGWLIDNE